MPGKQTEGPAAERVPVTFERVRSRRGLDVREATLDNQEGRFLFRVAALERHGRELDELLGELRVWAGFVEEPTVKERGREARVESIVVEASAGEVHVAFEVEVVEAAHASELASSYETDIKRNWVHWFGKSSSATVSVARGGKVRLRRPDKNPIEVTYNNSPVTAPTPNKCSVRGVHYPKSHYVIEGPGSPTGISKIEG